MGKNKFYQLENQFPQAGIVPPPNFKSFNKALNKKNTLSVSTSRSEEFVKKTFPLDGKTVFTGRNICQMEKDVARKTVPTKSKEVFLKKIVLQIGLYQQKALNKRTLFHLDFCSAGGNHY